MNKKKPKFIVFDIEVLPNFFILGVKPVGERVRIFEISFRKNDLEEMIDYLTENNYNYFVGYNCDGYDEPVLYKLMEKYHSADIFWLENYLQICDFIKKASDEQISKEQIPDYKRTRLFPTIDVMTMLFSSKLRMGLKPLQVTMCYPNVEEMTINWNEWIHPDDVDQLIMYNHNDLNSTTALLKLLKNDLKLRMDIKKNYGIHCLSRDGVGTGVAIFTKFVCQELGLIYPSHLKNYVVKKQSHPVSEILLPEIQFTTPEFKKVHENFKNLVLNEHGHLPEYAKKKKGKGKSLDDDQLFSAVHNRLKHTFGLGGLHSVNNPDIYVSDEDYYLIDADVGSMYPSMCLAWKFAPSGFKEAFMSTMQKVYNQRMEAKHVTKDKQVDKTMKLVLNSILGNLRQEYSPYYAPEVNSAICINGQLFLAMLIERLEKVDGIRCVMSNTDGITCLIRKDKIIEYYMICDEWMDVSRLVLEFVEYEKMVIRSVNDYVAFTKGYSETAHEYDFPNPEDILEYNFSMIKSTPDCDKMLKYQKQKGASFVAYPRVGKGLNSLIVPKAVINYFGRGIPIERTIKNVKSIFDYVMYQKVGKQFKVLWGDEQIQHISRFYANSSKPILRKFSPQTKKYSSILAGYGVDVINDVRDKKLEDYNINFKYYIRKANEIISVIESRTMQKDLFFDQSDNGIQGSLF